MQLNDTNDETTLRRRLLFRLLKGFDFDRPVFRHERISDAVPNGVVSESVDTFVFNF